MTVGNGVDVTARAGVQSRDLSPLGCKLPPLIVIPSQWLFGL